MAREGISDYELKLVKELRDSLATLVETYVANAGTPDEFISCITPKEVPWYWVRARQAIAKADEYWIGKGSYDAK